MNTHKYFAIVVSLLVLAVVCTGFYVSGQPVEHRMSTLDWTRVQHLRSISIEVSSYVKSYKRLPESAAVLVDGGRINILPVDPKRKTNYIYEITSDSTYDLCAHFSRASNDTEPDDFWYHPAGKHCYRLTVNLNE